MWDEVLSYSSTVTVVSEVVLCGFALECLRKYKTASVAQTGHSRSQMKSLYSLYSIYHLMLFLLFGYHPAIKLFFDMGLISNPCLVVKPCLFTLISIMFYFHLLSAIDWLELAVNGYQLVEINQNPVIAGLIGIACIEGSFIAYADGSDSSTTDQGRGSLPSRYFTSSKLTCFDPVTGTMRVLLVKAAIVSFFALVAYLLSLLYSYGTLKRSKKGTNMNIVGFKVIFKVLFTHCVAGVVSNMLYIAQIWDFLSDTRFFFFFGYVPTAGFIATLLNPIVYRLVN